MLALFVIIARPLVPAVADSGIARMASPIALSLICWNGTAIGGRVELSFLVLQALHRAFYGAHF